ncbi:MAG TPA: NAD-dependent epimerase/dehydratase family protein [Solirubrobacteraceae bacterium]|nr:NAD-dependent epimerase/dehydratase family protein [Solirubrobacteraceae bacterium]
MTASRRVSRESHRVTRPLSEERTVVVTGTTGTVGSALLPRLEHAHAVTRIVVLGRHAPGLRASAKVEFRQADVRDGRAVDRAVRGADVVVHLAYALYGVGSPEQSLFATNVEGSLNLARAARAAGAKRFVYTSSAAVYGFHDKDTAPVDESAPLRASGRHFYGRHKAQAETVIRKVLARADMDAYFFRPCAVVGPHAVGAAIRRVPRPALRATRRALLAAARSGLRPFVPAPPAPLQFVHEDDVADALLAAVVGKPAPGTYNLAGDGPLAGSEFLSLIGLRPLPVPEHISRGTLHALAGLPPVLPASGWAETLLAPLILDCTAARQQLGWRPRYTSREALLSTRRAVGW